MVCLFICPLPLLFPYVLTQNPLNIFYIFFNYLIEFICITLFSDLTRFWEKIEITLTGRGHFESIQICCLLHCSETTVLNFKYLFKHIYALFDLIPPLPPSVRCSQFGKERIKHKAKPLTTVVKE